jgi:transposase
MHRDPKQWAYVRRLILEEGASRRGVSRKTGLSRRTVRKMLAYPRPPSSRATPLNDAAEKLLEAARFLAAQRHSIDPTAYRRRALYQWGRTRDLVLKLDRSRSAALLRETAEVINGTTTATELNFGRLPSASLGARTRSSRPGGTRARGGAVREWLDRLLRGEMRITNLGDLGRIEGLPLLIGRINNGTLRQRKKAAAVVAHRRGVPIRIIATSLSMTRVSVRKYVRVFAVGGVEALFAGNRRVGGRRAENEQLRNNVFALLHEPPSAIGVNRTTWRMADLTQVLRERGTPVCAQVVREITRSAGWRWRRARKVLTSTDPEYREKVHHIQSVLAELHETEAFFSIDEFGPFSIRAQGGRALVGPGEIPTVPQYQKSKGSLIMTAALELSQNQVTHFYSPRKDTGEMIRMLSTLIREYKHKSRIYLSWDAASWHMSKMLHDHVDRHNEAIIKKETVGPAVALAPLPAGAQFLNVIESVFSGMARSIIANSNYGSIDEARAAIDRYVQERNAKFRSAPKRAGGAIWGAEREPSRFSESNNCKDPLYYR